MTTPTGLTEREREYLCVIADVKHENSELRTEIDRLQTEAETRDILLTAAQESNQRLVAERDAAQADAKRLKEEAFLCQQNQ